MRAVRALRRPLGSPDVRPVQRAGHPRGEERVAKLNLGNRFQAARGGARTPFSPGLDGEATPPVQTVPNPSCPDSPIPPPPHHAAVSTPDTEERTDPPRPGADLISTNEARPEAFASVSVTSDGIRHRDHIDPEVWTRPDMRRHLALRDIAAVYRLLQRHGVSQRAIAARAEQSQSEVSEIIAGRRQVASYDVLLRIATGLDVPRGWMGLAYHNANDQLLQAAP